MSAGDGRILRGFDFDDLDEMSIAKYREKFAAAKPQHPWLAFENKGLLERLGCWSKDRETGKYGLTLAGLLMFGKHEAIVAPDAAPDYHVDYRSFGEQQTGDHTWTDRLFPDGTWEPNLFQFFDRCWVKLTSDLDIPRAESEARSAGTTPVHVALREAVVNAIVHTDYSAPGGIVLERHPERFRMENPGSLMISQEQLRRGGVSHCRNKFLQRMFTLMGCCDQAGAGYRRISEGWQSQFWPEPTLITQENPHRVRLDFLMRNVLPEQIFALRRSRASSRR